MIGRVSLHCRRQEKFIVQVYNLDSKNKKVQNILIKVHIFFRMQYTHAGTCFNRTPRTILFLESLRIMEYLEKMSYDLELPEGYNELSIVNDQLHV